MLARTVRVPHVEVADLRALRRRDAAHAARRHAPRLGRARRDRDVLGQAAGARRSAGGGDGGVEGAVDVEGGVGAGGLVGRWGLLLVVCGHFWERFCGGWFCEIECSRSALAMFCSLLIYIKPGLRLVHIAKQPPALRRRSA